MDLPDGLWSAGRALVPLKCLLTPSSSLKHMVSNGKHHCSQYIPQKTSKNIPVHGISFSHKLQQTSGLKNENHLERVLAKLHPGSRVEVAAEEFWSKGCWKHWQEERRGRERCGTWWRETAYLDWWGSTSKVGMTTNAEQSLPQHTFSLNRLDIPTVGVKLELKLT